MYVKYPVLTHPEKVVSRAPLYMALAWCQNLRHQERTKINRSSMAGQEAPFTMDSGIMAETSDRKKGQRRQGS
ncbi:uncharacterized protein N7506_011507 [Penicillium brevicompactum]|uniref:uncharacterized protein n=1 Tax=Penicillium brevicompactum TaxID=5074 RepID=UPI002540716E|nr:uncharacterized protein N7506_011507 [Penicillium brevicompactum]KAJ5318803.1 hypothetical protein N7506_011507 [Penicillium brevicompactum]